jgi:hypothetical protein
MGNSNDGGSMNMTGTSGLTQILKGLNATTMTLNTEGGGQTINSLKDSKLIKINQSKKRLESARKTRIQQI